MNTENGVEVGSMSAKTDEERVESGLGSHIVGGLIFGAISAAYLAAHPRRTLKILRAQGPKAIANRYRSFDNYRHSE